MPSPIETRRVIREEFGNVPRGRFRDWWDHLENLDVLSAANLAYTLGGAGSPTEAYLLGGGKTVTSGATLGNQARYAAATNSFLASNAALVTGRAMEFEAAIRTPSTVTSIELMFGLKLTGAFDTATDDNGAFFIASAGGNWRCAVSVGGVDTVHNLGSQYALAADTEMNLRVFIDSRRVPYFIVNGVEVHRGPRMADAIKLFPFAGVETAASATRSVGIRYLYTAMRRRAA